MTLREYALVALNFALAATLAGLLGLPFVENEHVSSPMARTLGAPQNRIMFADITGPARSLFARPTSPPAVVAPVPVASPQPVAQPAREPTLRLVGIVLSQNERAAFIAVEGRQELARVVDGADVEGWKVLAIGRNDVELTKSGRTNRLVLDPPKAP